MSARDIFAPMKSIVSQGLAKAGIIKQGVDQKIARHKFLKTAPVPREEMSDVLCNWIDKVGALHRKRMRKWSIDWLIENPDKEIAENDYVALLTNPNGEVGIVTQPALFAMFPDLCKTAVREYVQSIEDYPEAGPTRESRIAEMERLDSEIAALEAEEAELLGEIDGIRNQLGSVDRRPRKQRK